MALFFSRLACGALLPLVLGCSLTSQEVEPALPAGRVNDNDTVVCHIDQKSAVASNYFDLGTLFLSFFGDTRSVVGKFPVGGALTIRAAFAGNQATGLKDRVLQLSLPAFKGTGTYPVASPATYYQEYTPPANSQSLGSTLTLSVVPATPAQVVITEWNAATRHLQGTFLLTVAAPAAAQNIAITDGRFDLTVD